jgi:activating signal cointegrator 1
MRIKCLTLTQPWATLVAIGAKRIETRSWATSYRGPLAIHAATSLKPVGGRLGLHALCGTPPFCDVLLAAGYSAMLVPAWGLPLGAIVAVRELIDCVPTQHPGAANAPGKPWFVGAQKGVGQHYYEVPPPLDSDEYAFGDYSAGRYAWLLDGSGALAEPIPARGALGLWDYDLPDDVVTVI